ncbi:MAG TPA: FHA domain-containing protein [Candidatus Limnocylindrales bacterium]|jgi:pSer/pThr/pTyr-binding forkhead associated (FHA) protein|nr:FHA domain-containing protein [Candidatus Limnocylindrales bacterium]
MDPFLLTVWVVRLLFLGLLYLFLLRIARALVGDLRAAASEPGADLGRLVVVTSPGGEPEEGASLPLDAITTIGRDVNNAIVVEDQFVSTEHAILTFRGRAWYVEDLGSTNGTFVNGAPVTEVTPLGYGDAIQVGQVRLRLERPRSTASRSRR